MKKLLFILSIFITSISYGQSTPDTVFIKIKSSGGGKTDLSNYFTKGQIDSINAGYYTKSQVDSIVATINATVHINNSAEITYTGDGTSGNPFIFSIDSLNVGKLNGGKIDTSHIPISIVNITQQGTGYPMIRASGDTIYSKNIEAGTNVTLDSSDGGVKINVAAGASGISKLGTGYLLTKINDSTYNSDTAAVSVLYPRRKDSTVSFTTPYQSSLKQNIITNLSDTSKYVKKQDSTVVFTTPTQSALKAGLSSTQTFTGINSFQLPTFGSKSFKFITGTGVEIASAVNGNTDAAPVFQWNMPGGGYLGGYLGDVRIVPGSGRSVLINTTIYNSSALINSQSTTQGSLLTPMTTTQMNAISSPATGLQVTNITIGRTCTYDGSGWRYSPNVYTGTAAPTTIPLAVGDRFDDTTNKKSYEAMGTSSSSDWVIQN